MKFQFSIKKERVRAGRYSHRYVRIASPGKPYPATLYSSGVISESQSPGKTASSCHWTFLGRFFGRRRGRDPVSAKTSSSISSAVRDTENLCFFSFFSETSDLRRTVLSDSFAGKAVGATAVLPEVLLVLRFQGLSASTAAEGRAGSGFGSPALSIAGDAGPMDGISSFILSAASRRWPRSFSRSSLRPPSSMPPPISRSERRLSLDGPGWADLRSPPCISHRWRRSRFHGFRGEEEKSW